MLLASIKDNLVEKNKKDLLRQMGYKSLDVGLKTLESLLQEKNLISWMSKSHFDFVYTSQGFLKALSHVLNINNSLIIEALNEIEQYQYECDRIKGISIFVNTQFQRTTEPIFILALLESKRHIKIDKNLLIGKNEDQIILLVSNIVRTHHKENNGQLVIFGKIHNYILSVFGKNYIFDVNGTLLDSSENIKHIIQKATLSLV